MRPHDARRHLVGLILAVLLLGLAAPALAGEPTDFVKGQTAKVTDILSQPESKKRAKKLDTILQATVDFRELAARSLKGHWEERTPEEQEEFLRLLQEMLEANYASKLSGQTLGEDYEIEYTGEKTRKNLAIVKTRIRAGEDLKPVEYKLIRRDKGEWIVFDIVIDDISLEETYRESYTEIIKEEGWDSLIQRMKDKIKEIEAANAKKG